MRRNAWMQSLIEMLLEQAEWCDEACGKVDNPITEASSEMAVALIRSSATAKTIAAHLQGMLASRKGLTYELGVMMFWARNPIIRASLGPYDVKGNWEALISAAGIGPDEMRAGFADEARRLGYSSENAEQLFDIELGEAFKGTVDNN